MSATTVELRVARAIARWNLRSSWRKRSSWRRKSSLGGELALALDRAAASRRSRRRWRAPPRAAPRAARAGGAPRARPRPRSTRISWRERTARAGPAREPTKMPPDWPRRTSSTPASASALIASRRVGRLIRIWAASSRSEGRRSPMCRSPRLDLLGDLLDGLLEGPASRDGLERALQTGASIGGASPARAGSCAARRRPARAPGARRPRAACESSAPAVAIARVEAVHRARRSARSSPGPRSPYHSRATWISPPQLARKSGT